MELIYITDLNKITSQEALVATIGQFDGLHLGHKELFKKTMMISQEHNLKSAVITFDPHPDYVLGRTEILSYITPLNEKKKLLEEIGFDYLFVINFTKEIASLEPMEFVNSFLKRLNVIEVVVGFDFSFGSRGKGKAEDITKLSKGTIKTTIIPKVTYHNEKIGSTKVKDFIENGQVEELKAWLGRYYKISGKVIEGMHIGKTINIPTANIAIPEDFMKVKPGVYAVMVEFEKVKYIGIANIGHNPSFNYQIKNVLEVHILDFNQDIYGKVIDVTFISFLRSEKKFPSIALFQDQIKNDTIKATEIIKPMLQNQTI